LQIRAIGIDMKKIIIFAITILCFGCVSRKHAESSFVLTANDIQEISFEKLKIILTDEGQRKISGRLKEGSRILIKECNTEFLVINYYSSYLPKEPIFFIDENNKSKLYNIKFNHLGLEKSAEISKQLSKCIGNVGNVPN
jgi:hypothetical protein